MKKAFKIFLMIAMVIYIISPIDFVPGPIDDALILLVALAGHRNQRIAQID